MRAIALTVPSAEAELAADRLWSAGARAVEERDAGYGEVTLLTQLSSNDATSLERLGEMPSRWRVDFVDLPDQPAQTWREFAEPIWVHSTLVLAPAWALLDVAPDVTQVSIEPGGSFGLGDHPTTRLSAAAVDRAVRAGASVLDVGCGSGVLAIVAALRGARPVQAIDNAEAAFEATAANASANGVGHQVAVSTRSIEAVTGSFDLVVANILAPVLVEMADDLRRLTAPTGRLIISGVLAGAYEHVVEALHPMRVERADQLAGWASVEFVQAP